MRSGGSGSPRSRTAGPRTGRRLTGPSTLQIDWSVNQREKTVRAAAVQLSSTEDKERNLEAADRLTRDAAADGAELVVLPEKFNLLGTHDDFVRGAETLEHVLGHALGAARVSWQHTRRLPARPAMRGDPVVSTSWATAVASGRDLTD